VAPLSDCIIALKKQCARGRCGLTLTRTLIQPLTLTLNPHLSTLKFSSACRGAHELHIHQALPPRQVLLRALRDFNLGKLTADDEGIFLGLLNDLFPKTAEQVPRAIDHAFEAKVWVGEVAF